jgi:hypothetical protein
LRHMAEFDPELFKDKYANYFSELQRAYKNAFDTMNDQFESDVIHAIDQTILNESEPFFEDGQFDVHIPENAHERFSSVSVEADNLERVLGRYVDEIENELHQEFDVEQERQE